MFRKISTLFFLVVFGLSLSLIARDNFARVHKVTAEDEERFEQKLRDLDVYITAPPNMSLARTEVGRTWYDYATNNTTGRQIAHAYNTAGNGIHVAFMKRATSSTDPRYVTYDYYDETFGLFFGNQSVTEAVATGWGRVVNGRDDEALMSMHGGGIWLWQDAAESGYSFTGVQNVGASTGGVFPGLGRQGDAVVFVGQLSNGNWVGGDTVLVSFDYMQTWQGRNIAPLDPLTADAGQAEFWPTFDPTDATNNTFAYVYAPDVTASAPNGSVAWANTTDGGATWTSTEILNDDAVQADGTNYIVEEFAQTNGFYTADGNYHVVYGAVQGVDTVNDPARVSLFPILYWNKDDAQFIELTSQEKGRPADTTLQNNLANLRPGNGLGNAYPILSEGPGGELVAVWQQWEDNGAGGLNTTVPSGGNEIFLTDIWGAYSPDGGATWSAPFYVAGSPDESDVFPNITPDFSFDTTGDSLVLDLVFMMDTEPGVSLFAGGNNPSECVWYYERVVVETPVVTGIEDLPNTVIGEFALAQNYPNPFNPTTTIEFSLSNSAEIRLEVFNLAGQKVATLVDGRKAAGEYTVDFDASSIASGVYFYRLSSADINVTRKMILMK